MICFTASFECAASIHGLGSVVVNIVYCFILDGFLVAAQLLEKIPEEILTFFMFGGHHSEADFAGPEINLQRFRLSTLMDVDLRDLIVSNLGCFIFQMSSNRPSYS
ncbi:hypothetical protein AAHE18_04G166400 [Arachis hypogaea]